MSISTQLSGKTALVTGATSGIGLGIAQALYSAGANVVVSGLPDPNFEKTLPFLFPVSAESGRVQFLAGDLTQAQSCQTLVHDAISLFGAVDILVNNAGMQFVSDIEAFPPERWQQVMDLNLSAPFYLTQAVLPEMRARKWGRIVNIASVHGHVASKNKAAYVAAKHGLIGLTKVTALETAGAGVTCNAICPGWVRTPLVLQQIDALAKEAGITSEEAEKKLLSEKQPSQAFVTPEQIGSMVCFLCSEAAAQMTGSSQIMDGGWMSQ